MNKSWILREDMVLRERIVVKDEEEAIIGSLLSCEADKVSAARMVTM
jgi:hypothetical protein